MSTVFDPKTDLHYLLTLWLWRVGCMFSGILLCRLWLSFRSTVSSNLPQWGKILPQTFFGHNEPKCIKSWSGVLPDSYFILHRLILYSYKKCMLTKNTYHLWSCTGSKASMILKKKTKELCASDGVYLFSLFIFFSGRESERKLAVQLAPSSELPSDSSWTSGPPDTLTPGHLDDLAPDKKVQPPHSPRDFFWQIALRQELLLNYLSLSEYFTPVNATTQYW